MASSSSNHHKVVLACQLGIVLISLWGFNVAVTAFVTSSSGISKSQKPALSMLLSATNPSDEPPGTQEGGVLRRAWVMPKAGKISRIRLQDEYLPPPTAGQVCVKVRAIGLNFADVFSCLGLYSATPTGHYIPGLEFSGTVHAVGEGVTSLALGDKVLGFTRFGAYASHINIPTDYVRPLPEGWSFEEGASFVVQGLTAWHGLMELGAAKEGQTALIHSAAGGVGLLAMEICRLKGIFPIATIGSDAKAAFLKERCGITDKQIIVRRSSASKFRAQLEGALEECSRCKEGYHVIMDALGGMYFDEGMRALRRNGRMITFGMADYMSTTDSPRWLSLVPRYLMRAKVDPGYLIGENKSVMGFNLIWLTDKVQELNIELDDMMKLDWRPPHVGQTFDFNTSCVDAIKYLQGGKSVGKVVMVVPP